MDQRGTSFIWSHEDDSPHTPELPVRAGMNPPLRMHSHASEAAIPLASVPSSATDVAKCKETCACVVETGVAGSPLSRGTF